MGKCERESLVKDVLDHTVESVRVRSVTFLMLCWFQLVYTKLIMRFRKRLS